MSLKTSEQLRAARAILRITQDELASMSGVSAPTIKRLEAMSGPLGIQLGTLEKLQSAFHTAGVQFTQESHGGMGVKFRNPKYQYAFQHGFRSLNFTRSQEPYRRMQLSRSMLDQLQEWGACILTNFSINSLLFKELDSLRIRIFSLPQEAKQEIRSSSLSKMGYLPFDTQQNFNSDAEARETFSIAWPQVPRENDTHFKPQPITLSAHIPDFYKRYNPFTDQVRDMITRVFETISTEIIEKEDFFEPMLRNSTLSMQLERYSITNGISPSSQSAAHKDFSFITIISNDTGPGLELFSPTEKAWMPIKPAANEFLVLAGEMMDYVTNGRIRSAIHRVSSGDASGKSRYSTDHDPSADRYSTKFFVMGNDETQLKPFSSTAPNKYLMEDPSYANMTPLQFARMRSKEFQSADLEHFNALPVLGA